jgi:uncharacterized membrane protein YgdD (TMEM256/DUF423 family)
MDRFFFAAGSISAFLAVALGAFAAHGLKARLSPDMLEVFEVGVRYHMYHSLGLLAVSFAMAERPQSSAGTAGWFFLAGIIIFSGSLYLLSLTGLRWLGAVTPFGGIAFLIGWVLLAWAAWR